MSKVAAWRASSLVLVLGAALLGGSSHAAASEPRLTQLTPMRYHVIQDIAVSADGGWAVYVDNGAIFVKKVGSSTRSPGKKIGIANNSLQPLEISENGRVVVAEMESGSSSVLVRWTRSTGKKRALGRGIDFDFAQTADGSRLAYVDGKGAVWLFSASTNTSTLVAEAPDEEECYNAYYYDTNRAIAISDDGSTVVYSDCNHANNKIQLAVWKAESRTSSFISGTRAASYRPVELTADGSTVFYQKETSGDRRYWYRVDPTTGKATEIEFPVAASQRNQVQFATFSADGRWAAYSPNILQSQMSDANITKFNSYVWRMGTKTRKVLFKARRDDGDLVTGYPMNITPDGSAVSVVAHGWDATPGADKAIVAVWSRS